MTNQVIATMQCVELAKTLGRTLGGKSFYEAYRVAASGRFLMLCFPLAPVAPSICPSVKAGMNFPGSSTCRAGGTPKETGAPGWVEEMVVAASSVSYCCDARPYGTLFDLATFKETAHAEGVEVVDALPPDLEASIEEHPFVRPYHEPLRRYNDRNPRCLYAPSVATP